MGTPQNDGFLERGGVILILAETGILSETDSNTNS